VLIELLPQYWVRKSKEQAVYESADKSATASIEEKANFVLEQHPVDENQLEEGSSERDTEKEESHLGSASVQFEVPPASQTTAPKKVRTIRVLTKSPNMRNLDILPAAQSGSGKNSSSTTLRRLDSSTFGPHLSVELTTAPIGEEGHREEPPSPLSPAVLLHAKQLGLSSVAGLHPPGSPLHNSPRSPYSVSPSPPSPSTPLSPLTSAAPLRFRIFPRLPTTPDSKAT
jgi:hypothetical protein